MAVSKLENMSDYGCIQANPACTCGGQGRRAGPLIPANPRHRAPGKEKVSKGSRGEEGAGEMSPVFTSMSMTGALCFSWISLAKTAVILSFFLLSTGVMVNRNTRTYRNTIPRVHETRRYGLLRGPSSSSSRWLGPSGGASWSTQGSGIKGAYPV